MAQALGEAVDSSVRLAVVRAVSESPTRRPPRCWDAPGAPRVAARVDGDDITADVTAGSAEPAEQPVDDGGEATSRISLRLSESLKKAIDEAAARDGVSVNTWLVRAAATAAAGATTHRRGGQHNRLTGWVSG